MITVLAPEVTLGAVAELGEARLAALVEQATVDAYDDDERLSGFHAVIEENLAVPFRTTVLGVEVAVKEVELRAGSGIVAICVRGRHRQAIGILDLPLPDPPPEGSEWIEAYRYGCPLRGASTSTTSSSRSTVLWTLGSRPRSVPCPPGPGSPPPASPRSTTGATSVVIRAG
ncbi:hypothetical protein [Microbispora bryophytorum]|uniref:hypothetical protein n=1 Tax=Microbispora bryophytorum TaxID=1460882 RepID=UPI0033C4CE82